MTTTDTKKRILHLIERYGTERAQEAIADSRDAGMVTLKRHSERIHKAMSDVGAELDKLLAATGDLAYWKQGTALIEICLKNASLADPGDVPFPLLGEEAKLWHRAQASAYQHALEMMGLPGGGR